MEAGRSYRVIERLGEGAFGAVFLAESVGGGITKTVAIKVPHADRSNSSELVSRLRDEARMLSLVRHRAIVRLDDLVELDGVWSVVMEYVDGADVATVLAQGALPTRAALAVAEEIANALHVAWNQTGPEGRPLHLLHRDVKPSNIRITPAGEVKLLDFGVARAEFDAREADATQTVFGTPTYLAPERYNGVDSPAGDIYALGITLFEMLTGVPPGKSAMDADRQPPGRRWTEQWAWLGTVHPQLHALTASMLHPDPERRPSARDTARKLGELRGLIGGETLEDWAERTLSKAAASKGADGSGSLLIERSSTASTPRRAGAWLLGIGGVVLVLGVLGVAIAAATAALVARQQELSRLATPGVEAAPPPAPSLPPAAAPSVPASPVTTPAPASASPSPAPNPSAASPLSATPAPDAGGTPMPGGTAAPAGTPTATVAAPPAASPASAPATPAPKPSPAAKPAILAPALPEGSGKLIVTGDVKSTVLRGAATLPGVIPVGSYAGTFILNNDTAIELDGIVVSEGATTTVRCSATFNRCSIVR